MKEIWISDVTMKHQSEGFTLSFKEKLELAKLLDRLHVSVIELEGIERKKADSLLVKSVASAVKYSCVAVPVKMNDESVQDTWNALKEAVHPRLQVYAPVSTVQMEYICHKKPDAMFADVVNTIAACRKYTEDVEFIAGDATRGDLAFLVRIVNAAVEAGASTVTICNTAGMMLPDEFTAFLDGLCEQAPALKNVRLGVACSNELAMADACAVSALHSGVQEIKAAAYPVSAASLPNIARLLSSKGEQLSVSCGVRCTEMGRIIRQIEWMCSTGRGEHSPFDNGVQDHGTGVNLTANDSRETVLREVAALGYELSEEDGEKVWEAFGNIARRKDEVGPRELDAIVAAAAMQVPPSYQVDSYVINTGSNITAMAHMKLKKQNEVLEGISLGDGPIDAAFLAIEQIAGRHYELDDFQIQAVTEGREAMGETVVKLRSNGRLYSGRGISTDIVGASIRAYLNALNKIVYEEGEA